MIEHDRKKSQNAPPSALRYWKHYDTAGQALSLSYGRYIAEFLKEGSLVHLGLLDLSTCVGLRYGQLMLTRTSFSGRLGLSEFRPKGQFYWCFDNRKTKI